MKFIVAVSLALLALATPFEAKSLRATPITDEELFSLSKTLHDADVNGVTLQLDLQGRTTVGSTVDVAPNRLIVTDPLATFSKPTYAAAIALMNNYQRNVDVEDVLTAAQLAEEVAFIDAIMQTTVMQTLHQFLVTKGEASADVATFKQYLNTIWFGRYARYVAGVVATSGWEHMTVGEKTLNNTVAGFHSWVYLYNEEEDGDCNYLGYVTYKDTGKTTLLQAPMELYGGYGSSVQFNLGTSPELEVALATLCFVARPNVGCTYQGSNGVSYEMEAESIDYNGVTYVQAAHSFAA